MEYAIADGATSGKSSSAPRLADSELFELFTRATQFVVDCGFEDEIEWQRDRCLENLTESEFLSEAAWVVLSSGMRETVIRSRFLAISEAFHYWEDADAISQDADVCRDRALQCFRHEGKISAIVSIVSHVADIGLESVKLHLQASGVDYLSTFPYMGPATSYHFAKNIGLDVVKPDRHLLRISVAAGFDSPDELCRVVSEHAGESVAVVDLILWRYATLRGDYLETFAADDSFLAIVEP